MLRVTEGLVLLNLRVFFSSFGGGHVFESSE